MMPYKERVEQINKLMHDPDVEPLESFVILWHWFALEYAYFRRAKADKAVAKAGTRYNNDIDIVNFRKAMTDL